jgi:hypothetical protein
VYDFLDGMFGSFTQAKIAGLSSLQANTDQRLTGTADRLTSLEYRYERMHIVMAALWGLLKERAGLTDEELKKFVLAVEVSESKAGASAGAMPCPHCSRMVRKSASRCPWCGTAITSGDAFEGT